MAVRHRFAEMAPLIASGILPYEVHTTRELEFMLERGKPSRIFATRTQQMTDCEQMRGE
jgi:hypothetical protein